MNLRPHIEKFARRLGEVEAALSDPKLFENPAKSQEMAREYARLKTLTEAGRRYLKAMDDLAQHEDFLKTEPAESELAQMTREEMAALQVQAQRFSREVMLGLAPPDPADSRNSIME